MHCQFERTIDAPPDRVFEVASDFAGAPRRISAITRVEMLTEGPVRVGTRFRETRTMFGREATEEMTVTEFDAGHRYVLGCENHGTRYRSEVRVAPHGEGQSTIVMTFEARPLTMIARVLGVLTKPMVKKVVQACEKDLDDLKAAVETGR